MDGWRIVPVTTQSLSISASGQGFLTPEQEELIRLEEVQASPATAVSGGYTGGKEVEALNRLREARRSHNGE